MHQNTNGGYLWGLGILGDYYFLLYAFTYF